MAEDEVCEHPDEYPVAAFSTSTKPWLWLYCEDCATNHFVTGETNDRED